MVTLFAVCVPCRSDILSAPFSACPPRARLELMTLTISELESVVPEIQHAIRGAVFSGVESPDPLTCVLSFAGGKDLPPRRLLFSRRPRLTRINLLPVDAPAVSRRAPASPESALFVRTLSDALRGMVAGPMRPRFQDRVVSLDMLPGKPEREGDRAGRMTILFECTGMHPNMFLIDERQMIVAMFARSTSHRRTLDVGCRYEQPAAADAVKSTGRRVDVVRFVGSGKSMSDQIAAMYDPLDDSDEKRRELAGLGERLGAAVQARRKVAESVMKDLEAPARPGRPADLHDRLRERLARIQGEIDELQEILSGVRGGKVDVVDRARELVLAFEAQQAERESRWAERGGRERPSRDGGYPRRDDRDSRPPRPEGGYPRRDDRAPRPPRPEGGYPRRDDRDSRPPRPEGGYPRRDDRTPRPPRPEGGYPRRDDRDSRPPRPEGGYPRRDDRTSRPPRPEGGYPRRDDRDSRPPRPEGGYPRRDDRTPRPPRPEGGYPRRDDRDSRPPRPEGGYPRRDDRAPRPPRPEGGYPRRDDRDSRPPRPEGGYPRRDDRAPRPPRPEGGYPRRDDRDSRPPRPEGGYPRRDDRAPRPPRPEGGYPRRDDRAPRPPRPEGGYPRRDDRDSRPPRREGPGRPRGGAPRQSPKRSTPRG